MHPTLLEAYGKGAGWKEGFSERGVTLLGIRKSLEFPNALTAVPHPCLLPSCAGRSPRNGAADPSPQQLQPHRGLSAYRDAKRVQKGEASLG